MPKMLPKTAVDVIDYLQPRLGVIPSNTRGRVDRLQINDERAVIIRTVLDIVAEVPDELLILSSAQRAQFQAALQDLRHAVQLLSDQDARARSSHGFPLWEPMRWLDGPNVGFSNNRYATEVLRDLLNECPDEVVRAGTRDLPFITDPVLRDHLRVDLSSVNATLADGQYKAATVLGGSVIEALLLWGLSRKTAPDRQNFIDQACSTGTLKKQPDSDINNWDLHTFIEVSASGNLIRSDTVQIARVAKNFRNLIHPGRERRLNQSCDRGTALAVASAVEHIITDFTRAMP